MSKELIFPYPLIIPILKIKNRKSPIKFLAIIALFFAISFTANAQRGDRQALSPEQIAEKETTRLVEKLSLNETQTAQVQEITLAYAKQLQEAHENNEGDRAALKEIRTAINTEKTTELQQVLTEEQFIALDEIQAKKGKRKGGKKGR